MKTIMIEHLSRDYGGGKGVFDLSLAIEESEIFGFLGPNGAGKTTTIRHLMGFLKPQQGRCRIRDRDCWRERALIQSDLGYIPGEIAFFEDMNGQDFLSFYARYRGLKTLKKQTELLERFALDPKMKIRKMSKGTKQKLGIVAAFMHEPSVLILDEPTGGLDPLMQNEFMHLLRESRQKGCCILLSSHIFEEVERCCDRIAILRQGRLMTVDSVRNLRQRHVRTYQVKLPDEATARAFAADFHGTQEGLTVTVSCQSGLEDIFLQFYGGNHHA